MFGKIKFVPIAIIISLIIALAPIMFLVQGQVQSLPAEQFVTLADKAAQQVQSLIDLINENDDSFDKIDSSGLRESYQENVILYETAGLENLVAAQEALANSENELAADHAIEALSVFREVYGSIHAIMEKVGLEHSDFNENQGLLEAIARELQRIDRLRGILPIDAPEDIATLLASAEELLNLAKEDLLNGNEYECRIGFLEAKGMISEIYSYLKTEAEFSNEWRLVSYCEGLQERIRERFRYGQEQGIDFAEVLKSYGYESEADFMTSLQNSVQTALNEQNFEDALQDCEALGQMVQQMEQSINQEINRHQLGYGGGSSSGDSGAGLGGSGYGRP